MSNMIDFACDDLGCEFRSRQFSDRASALAFAESLHCDWDMRTENAESVHVEWAEMPNGKGFDSSVSKCEFCGLAAYSICSNCGTVRGEYHLWVPLREW